MAPRNPPQPPVDVTDPDGLMADARASAQTPAPTEDNPLPVPDEQIDNSIAAVEDRVLEGMNVYERRAAAAMAMRLAENGAFQLALNELRAKYLEILLSLRVGSPEYTMALTRCQMALVMLGEIAGQLGIIVDAVAFDERATRGDLDERTRSQVDRAAHGTVFGSK